MLSVNREGFADGVMQATHFCARIFTESRFVVHMAGKFRRSYLAHFRKTYVARQLSAREGACRRCGTCCNLLFTCPMLCREGDCLIYGKCRPQSCKVFPVDERDLAEVALYGKPCGYRFNRALPGQEKKWK